jgi:hypothetical protein
MNDLATAACLVGHASATFFPVILAGSRYFGAGSWS